VTAVDPAWEHALSELEARLDAAEADLARPAPEREALAPFVPPTVPGTLPPALLGRAERALARAVELERRLAEELERVRDEVRRIPRRPESPGRARFEVDA
jgi:hypothetical protein